MLAAIIFTEKKDETCTDCCIIAHISINFGMVEIQYKYKLVSHD